MYVSVKPKKFTINISLAVQSLKMPNKRNYVQLSFGTGIIEIISVESLQKQSNSESVNFLPQ